MSGPSRPSGPGKPGGKPFRPHWGRPQRPPDEVPGPAADGLVVLFGWHPVVEALRNPNRTPRRLIATENGARRLEEAAVLERIKPEIVRPQALDRMLGADAVHQGLYLEAEPLPSPPLDALPEGSVLLALDQVTDPHNVGAIVRSAAAFGVAGIITTARHSPAATGVLAKAASGGLEHVPMVIVRNLAETLIALGEAGVMRIGLDSEAPAQLRAVAPTRPFVLVLGAEGKGLRARTRDCCDVLARLDLPGAIRSLNVSNAAAVALHALVGEAGPGEAPAGAAAIGAAPTA